MIRSLRFRLLIATSAATAILLALFGTAIYLAMRHQLLADFDESLLAKAKMLASSVEQHGERLHVEFEDKDLSEFSATKQHPQFFELWSNGKVLARSESLAAADLPSTHAEIRSMEGKILLPNADRGRAAVLNFQPNLDEEGEDRPRGATQTCTLVVAGTPVDAARTLAYLGWLLTGSCVAAIGLSGAVMLGVVSHGIRPVNVLAKGLDSVQESDLSFRLPSGGVPAELSPIIDRLNALLDRLERAFAREKALTADVAHELRTPLAGLITTLEVCRSRKRESPAYESAIDECLAMMDGMRTMVENLLLLSRAESGTLAAKFEAVDVSSLLNEVWRLFKHRAERRSLNVEWSLSDACIAQADPSCLRIVLQNILDNAVSYVNEGGTIRICDRHDNDGPVVQITNTGSAIPAADASRIFDRFWRADNNRADTGIHCGLGMSLSQRLVGVLEGTLQIETSFGGTFAVCLRLPPAEQIGRAAPVAMLRGQ